MKQLLLVFIFGLLVIFGLVMLSYGILGLVKEFSSERWPKAEGVISSRDITVSSGKGGGLFCPRWIYGYRVDAKTYYGGRKTFGSQSCLHSKAEAESALETYPVGSKVSVIYDPSKPSHAALKVSDDGGAFWWFLTIGGLALIWLVGAFGMKTLRSVDSK